MNLKKLLFTCVAAVGLSTAVSAQDLEGGLFLGGTFYQGDLVSPHLRLQRAQPAIGLLGRYYFGPRFNLKGQFTYGRLKGDDQDYNDDRYRDKRNLRFQSGLFEASIQGELNILPFISNSKRYRFAPYVFAGIGFYYFNPKATVTGYDATGKAQDYGKQSLKTLGTEGQLLDNAGPGKKYNRGNMSIPYGLGIKYSLKNFWNIGLELGQRTLFHDYLDDVSTQYPDMVAQQKWSQKQFQSDVAFVASSPRDLAKFPLKNADKSILSNTKRANEKRNDRYMFVGITLTKTLRRFSCTNF